jgi:hypothetical protein
MVISLNSYRVAELVKRKNTITKESEPSNLFALKEMLNVSPLRTHCSGMFGFKYKP